MRDNKQANWSPPFPHVLHNLCLSHVEHGIISAGVLEVLRTFNSRILGLTATVINRKQPFTTNLCLITDSCYRNFRVRLTDIITNYLV